MPLTLCLTHWQRYLTTFTADELLNAASNFKKQYWHVATERADVCEFCISGMPQF